MSHQTLLDTMSLLDDPGDVYVCKDCGSPDVYTLNWVNTNTGRQKYSGYGQIYCNRCDKIVSGMETLEEFGRIDNSNIPEISQNELRALGLEW
ncbi:hypothetical protein [Acinetobacter sp.]|uniref:hypothetical protein n=1 Tax=Acinetobacter sp. TaxID=472 RepID=UPI003D077AEA